MDFQANLILSIEAEFLSQLISLNDNLFEI